MRWVLLHPLITGNLPFATIEVCLLGIRIASLVIWEMLDGLARFSLPIAPRRKEDTGIEAVAIFEF